MLGCVARGNRLTLRLLWEVAAMAAATAGVAAGASALALAKGSRMVPHVQGCNQRCWGRSMAVGHMGSRRRAGMLLWGFKATTASRNSRNSSSRSNAMSSTRRDHRNSSCGSASITSSRVLQWHLPQNLGQQPRMMPLLRQWVAGIRRGSSGIRLHPPDRIPPWGWVRSRRQDQQSSWDPMQDQQARAAWRA